MYAMPELLAREHQSYLLAEAEQHRRARVLARMRRAERRADRRKAVARAQVAAANDAARHAALVAHRAHA